MDLLRIGRSLEQDAELIEAYCIEVIDTSNAMSDEEDEQMGNEMPNLTAALDSVGEHMGKKELRLTEDERFVFLAGLAAGLLAARAVELDEISLDPQD